MSRTCFRIGWPIAVFVLLTATSFAADPSTEAVKPSSKFQPPRLPSLEFREADPKIIYGEDDRLDLYQETDAEKRMWAASTCALIEDFRIQETSEGAYSLTVDPLDVSGYPPCDGEPFVEQPTAAFCTGFLVGPDLIATAGHCIFSDDDLPFIRFVFGFVMEDESTPRTTFSEDDVYTGVEIIGAGENFEQDFAIVRVDRPVVAPGAVPFEIRRVGTVPNGTLIGVIGHPVGLPLKLGFGSETVVYDSSPENYFVANLDAYGGNSGSPVINVASGMVEGILVRGEQDFELGVLGGDSAIDCFRSRRLADDDAAEEATKSTVFAEVLFNPHGQLSLDKLAYRCEDTVVVGLNDADLAGLATMDILALTDRGDTETLSLAALPGQSMGSFEGPINAAGGDVVEGNGMLEVAEGDTVLFLYVDRDTGQGSPASVVANALIDCTAPTIANVEFSGQNSMSLRVSFDTGELAFPRVKAGVICDAPTNEALGELDAHHDLILAGLLPETEYKAFVSAEDPAGNVTTDDRGGACYPISTPPFVDRFTEGFFQGISDIEGKSALFEPVDDEPTYVACVQTVTAFPSPACGRRLFPLADDTYDEHRLTRGRTFPFFGETYSTLYVGSNGYITFGEGDTAFSPDFYSHFALPRVAPYFGDMAPILGGSVYLSEQADRVVVTFDTVSDFFGDPQSFQVELFYSGAIRMTWLDLTYPYAIVGLSPGGGIPQAFEESNLSAYSECETDRYGRGTCVGSGLMCSAMSGIDEAGLRGDTMCVLMLISGLLAMGHRKPRGQ